MIVSGEDDEEDEYEEQEQQQQSTPTPSPIVPQPPPTAALASAAPPANPAAFSPCLSPPAINISFTSSLFSFAAPSGSPRHPATTSASSTAANSSPSPSSTSSTAQQPTRAALPPRPTTSSTPQLSTQHKQLRSLSATTANAATRLSLAHTNATTANVAAVRDGMLAVLSGAQEAAANVRVASETALRLVELMRQVDVRMSVVKVAAAAAATAEGVHDDSEQHALP